jgi:hypothetical protein
MAHLGTYIIGGITYDRHTGRAVAGTDTVDTEFSEEFKNYYNTVNLENYKELSNYDFDGAGDDRAQYFMNANGEQILTYGQFATTPIPGITDGGPTEADVNENPNQIRTQPFYDFSKPNQENGASFTQEGKDFYTSRKKWFEDIKEKGLSQTEKPYKEWQTETLVAIEKELVEVTKEHYEKMKKTNSSQVKPQNIMIKEELEEESSEGGNGGGDKEANIYDLQSELKKLQKTDSILQRLSLRNLKYPIDADYGNTQDYVQIDQFTYQAVSPSIVFPQKLNAEEGSFDAGKRVASDTFFNGLDRGSPKNITIGNVRLPMPNQLNDSNNVAWGEDQLNALTAAAATLGAGGLQQGIDFFDDIRTGKVKGLDILGKILDGLGDTGKGLIGFLEQAKTEKNTNLMARSVVGSSLLNLAGFGLSPEAILARGAGVIPNANLELLFNAPALRAFRFDWKMSPRSQEEAIRINNIIRFFKQGMAAKKMSLNGVPDSYFLGTPNIFDISFKTSKTNTEITNTNHSVLRIKTCACVGAAVNYTPQGMWNAYEKGQPTSCILSLQFKELEPIYNTDYEEDPFEYDNMIGAVPTDAVGY